MMNDPILELYSLDAEMGLLGALMTKEAALDDVSDIVLPENFFIEKHRNICKTIFWLAERGKPFDVISVGECAGSKIDDIGGFPYLNELVCSHLALISPVRNAEIVKDKFARRELREALNDCASQLLNGAAEDLADELVSRIEKVTTKQTTSEPTGIANCLQDLLVDIENKKFGTNEDLLPTGIECLDKFFDGGFERQNVVVVAGRPSMGKTAFGMTLALSMAKQFSVLVFSMEMSKRELTRRAVPAIGSIPSNWLKGSHDAGNDGNWNAITVANESLYKRKLHMDDRSQLSMAQIRKTCKKHKRKYGLDVIVIDYLGLMRLPSDKGALRAQALGDLTSSIKSLAKDLNICVILLHQLNRANTDRTDKRPSMSDLRDSGAIEQDADNILLIHRDEYYDKEDRNAEGHTEIIVDKYRSGACGIINMTFEGTYSRFVEWNGERHNKPTAATEPKKVFASAKSKRWSDPS